MFSFDTMEEAKVEIKKIKPEKLESAILAEAKHHELSPSQLIDAVRDEIAELINGSGKMSAAKRQTTLAALEIELYTLRRCYHTMLAMRRQPAKTATKKTKKVARKAS